MGIVSPKWMAYKMDSDANFVQRTYVKWLNGLIGQIAHELPWCAGTRRERNLTYDLAVRGCKAKYRKH